MSATVQYSVPVSGALPAPEASGQAVVTWLDYYGQAWMSFPLVYAEAIVLAASLVGSAGHHQVAVLTA